MFCPCKTNSCLLPTNQKKSFAWGEILDLREENAPLIHRGQRSPEDPDCPTTVFQSSRATRFGDQMLMLVQENHLPHSFRRTDAVKSRAKSTGCSCCSVHTQAHTFTSFFDRGSLFPLCPWCSWLWRDCRNCPTWGGEGGALEIQLFHNPLHSALSCSSLKRGSICGVWYSRQTR